MSGQETRDGWTRIRVILQSDQSTLVLKDVQNDKEKILSIVQGLGEDLLGWREGVDLRVIPCRSGISYETYAERDDREPIFQLQVSLSGDVSYIARFPAILPGTDSINFFVQLIKGYLLGVLAFAWEFYRTYGVNSMIHGTVTFGEVPLCMDAFLSQSICQEVERFKIWEELRQQVEMVVAARKKAKEPGPLS